MQNKKSDYPMFATLRATCDLTGLSMYYLRTGCVSGQIPHVKAGCKYLINVPALLEQLEAESRQNMEV